VPTAADFVPPGAGLPQLWSAAQQCRGCDLYRNATQAVLGEGAAAARVLMVGEQPGDREDRDGRPFVGPAGQLLDKALEHADINRKDVYITNAVKHFKFEERGKRRIHKTPSATEVAACRPWLEAEIALVKPELIVCLGATAARAVIGTQHRILRDRGKFYPHPLAKQATATVHPSAILRAPDPEQREKQYQLFVDDLKAVRRVLTSPSSMRA
jgi:uracil-DNA glycosylase